MNERHIDLRRIRAGKGVQPISDAGPKPTPKHRIMDWRQASIGRSTLDDAPAPVPEERPRGNRGN